MSSSQVSVRKPPHVSTFFATFVALSILGVMLLIFAQGKTILTQLRESAKVVIELRPGASEAAKHDLNTWLESQTWAAAGSIKFIDKQTGAKLLREEFGDDFLRFDLDNPLHEVITVNLTADGVSEQTFNEIEQSILNQEAALSVYTQHGTLATVVGNANKVALGALILSLLLLLGVIALMINTTRLSLLNKARIIKNMELVGASWSFISKPFLRNALLLGASAGLLAGLLTLAVAAFAKTSIASVWTELPYTNYVLLLLGLILLGAMLNFVSTFAVVRKTLKLRVDDLAPVR